MSTFSAARAAFVAISATALAVLIAGTACTRRGGNGMPPVVTPTPINMYYVNPVTGNDANNGSSTAPFKTLTHAVGTVARTMGVGVTLSLATGTYSTKSGEIFPIVIPIGIIIAGSNYGHSPGKGTFINGSGEDTLLEKLLGAPAHTFFATLVVRSGVSSVAFDDLYVGSTVSILSGEYASVDIMGSASASQDTLGAMVRGSHAGGAILPSGSLSCSGCILNGGAFAVEAFTAPGATAAPRLVLGGPGASEVGAVSGLLTDGTATIAAANTQFESTQRAYSDALLVTATPSSAPSPSPTSTAYYTTATVDFGYGASGSQGDNTLAGANVSGTEIELTRGTSAVSARNDTWNDHVQGTTRGGVYEHAVTFGPGAAGRNVTISSNALGARAYVGPAPPPTPTPSPTPSTSASPSATASPT
jgi:hypothetical protein